MATLSLKANSDASIPSKSMDPMTMSAAQTLTGSYVATTDIWWVENFTIVEFWMGWTQGDETSMSVKVQTSYNGTTWGERPIVIDLGAGDGTGDAEPHQLVFTTANWPNDPAIAPVFVHGARYVRLMVKATGGTPTGTVQVTCMGCVGT
jgi:hypothetical protein